MDADTQRCALDKITSKVIACAHEVSNTLGSGFLEKVYENAMLVELRRARLRASQQVPFQVRYRDEVIGQYLVDILVNESVVLEIKACAALDRIHRAQCINYLNVTGLPVALLINFATPRVDVRRIVRMF
jgi:GxxExxY protein